MRARGLRTPRARAHIGTALGVALGGLSIGLATPAQSAPEGPDTVDETVDETVVEQARQGSVVVVDRWGPVALNRSKMSGVGPGLAPLELNRSIVVIDAG